MKQSVWLRRAAYPLIAVAIAYGAWGVIPHSGNASLSGLPPATNRPAAVSLTGKWVYRTSDTVENLYLKLGKGGAISGHGDSAVKDSKNRKKIDHSSIDVQSGKLSKSKLTLSIYITPIDWGGANTLVLVENLGCTVSSKVLHCRMDAPLYVNVRNIPQDFYRHA
jgi:hypothetical protein